VPYKQVLRAPQASLGLNGAGKSTLLRIMAGVDKDYICEISI
jgi:ABC-type sulfate/molybdate transport systems ATPase subunit